MLRAARIGLWFAVVAVGAFAAQQQEPSARELGNAGAAHYENNEYKTAEPLLLRAVALWQQTGREYDEECASALNNLGAVYRMQARFGEAKTAYEQAVAIREHNGTVGTAAHATVLHNLGRLYLDMGQYELAERTVRQALAIRREQLGERNVFVAQSTNLLGMVVQTTGHIEEANGLYREALVLSTRAENPNDNQTAAILINLGVICRQRDQLAQAHAFLNRASDLLKKTNADGELLATVLNAQATLARAEGDFTRAEACAERAVKTFRSIEGPFGSGYATSVYNLAVIYQERHRWAKANARYRQSLTAHEHAFGPNSPRLGDDLIGLGQVLRHMGQQEEAEALFLRVLQIDEQQGGATWLTGLSQAYLALVAADRKNVAGAERLFRNAVANLDRTFKPNDPRLIGILEQYAAVLRVNGRFAEAESTEVRAMKIRVQLALHKT